MTQDNLLSEANLHFNTEIAMVGKAFKGNGYHSLVCDGTWVHPTRDTVYYALHLLKAGEAEGVRRAVAILNTIVSLQDTNPYSATYGIWSWLYEEPVEKMSPPDWNWADFIGAALAHALKEFSPLLPGELVTRIRLALGHAAWSIFRRNVGPGYTNIAIMGVVVTAVAGELLDELRLVEYARVRLRTFIDYTHTQGGLNEYNSPTYTLVALHETERILQLVGDPEIREAAEALRRMIWRCLAERYHPLTGQLAAPHSRAYRDLLSPSAVHYIGWAVSGGLDPSADELTDYGTHLLCPEEYRQRFAHLPTKVVEQRDRFVLKGTDEASFYGTTWMNEEVALGSINHECFWAQRRPLLGYWANGAGEPAVLRLRYLKDGKDFASGGLHSLQAGNKILTGITTYTDRGDFHIHLDRPQDGSFTLSSLLLRYELTAEHAAVTQVDAEHVELIAGDWKALVTTPAGSFRGQPVSWRTGGFDGTVWLEAVLYEGEEKRIAFDESLHTSLALGTEILPAVTASEPSALTLTEVDNVIVLSWESLSLQYNPYGEAYEVE